MKLTILTENTANKRGMLAEHGLSVLAEHKGQRFLFDTGQSDVYLKNAAKLGISLKPLDGVVFSHGHYDHCDGFGYGLDLLAEEGSTLKVYTGQGAFSARTYTAPGTDKPRNVGSSWRPDTLPDMAKKSITFIQTQGLTGIGEDIWLLSQIPKLAEFEGVETGFFSDEFADQMQDEQLLLIRDAGRLHVIAGCCHMGIISCLRWVKHHFPEEQLGIVLAGMHLRSASAQRLNLTIEALRGLDAECLVPAHCTGSMGAVAMKLAFNDKCMLAEAGKVLMT